MARARQDLIEQDAAPPDKIAGRYRVLELLGRGGMGSVYRVHDEQTGRELALKCLHSAGRRDTRHLEEMFNREYRTLAQLSHPSVIHVHDYGVEDAGPYYTMDLLGGQDLHALAPLPWREACRYMREVCSSLALLHSRRLVHRDVSPRNVRVDEGRAKLIDFGAMVPMGAGHRIVGTPPLLAPEVLFRGAIDARCDLYALGATLYWALTGRHAYPARALTELTHVWQQRPPAPSSIAQDVPEALDALALSLLAQEVDARPGSAAEVMDRLSAIAGLDDDEHLHVPRAYLTTPTLHGRETHQEALRSALDRVADGPSGVLWFSGVEGVGRSRILGAAAVEARLAGANVIRLDDSDSQRGDCGIGLALLDRTPELLGTGHTAPGSEGRLRVLESSAHDDAIQRRGGLVSRARAVVRRTVARGPLVIVVDDVEKLDAPSQALLAALPKAARRRLLLVLAVREGAQLEPALEALRDDAELHTLESLTIEQTEGLLQAVFGDVPGITGVARRVHELSRGVPRTTMDLAQHLVDTGKARYELGGWVLPTKLARDDLPAAWTGALDARLDALGDDELELAEALAFALDYGQEPEELDALTSHGDTERRQTALDGLVAAGLMQVDGERFEFTSAVYRDHLRRRVPHERSNAIHLRLAGWLREHGHDAIHVARCQLTAGALDDAIDTLLQELESGTRWETAPSDYGDILQWALEAVDARQRPRRERFALLTELVRVGEHMGVPNMRAHFGELLTRLRADGALDAYEALPDDLDPMERLKQAFDAAQARFDALPEHERVLPPIEAVRALVMTARQAAAFSAASMDHELLSGLPDVSPFVPLSPAIQSAVDNALPAAGHLTAGRYEQALEDYTRTHARIAEPDRAGLEEDYASWAMRALHFARGHILAGLGMESALEHAEALEREPGWAICGLDVRRAFHLRLGAAQEAEACRLRMERMLLESGRRPPMVDTSARLELDTAAHAGDLPGARRAVERLKPIIEIQPGYACYAHYGPAVCEQLRGNHTLALEHAERALAMVDAGKHPTWPWIVHCVLECLIELGRFEEAKQRGLELLGQALGADLKVMSHHVSLPLAIAEARLGEFDRALERIEQAIAYREQQGSRGLDLGWAYEYRARVALWMGDHDAFHAAAARCAEEYGKGRPGSSLVMRYERLRADARQAGIGTPSMLPAAPDPATERSTLLLTSLEADSPEERAQRALELLMRESGADAGVLYRRTPKGLSQCAENLDDRVPPDLAEFVDMLAATPEDDDDTATQTVTQSTLDGGTEHWLPLTLGYARSNAGFQQTGIALLCFDSTPEKLSIELVEAVARVLQSAEGSQTH